MQFFLKKKKDFENSMNVRRGKGKEYVLGDREKWNFNASRKFLFDTLESVNKRKILETKKDISVLAYQRYLHKYSLTDRSHNFSTTVNW